MFDFLIGLIEEEVQKYKENPGAIENQLIVESPPSRGTSQRTRQLSPSFSSLQTTNQEQMSKTAEETRLKEKPD